MDPVTLTVIFKGLGLVLALVFGLVIARYGFLLYKDGAGLGRDKAAFEVGEIKVKAHSVGSVVMASAFLWAWAGVWISPDLDKTGDNYRVYSFQSDGIDVSVPSISTTISGESFERIAKDSEALREMFMAASSEDALTRYSFINGTRPTFVSDSTQAFQHGDSMWLTARLTSQNDEIDVVFESEYQSGEVTFTPIEVKKADEGPN